MSRAWRTVVYSGHGEQSTALLLGGCEARWMELERNERDSEIGKKVWGQILNMRPDFLHNMLGNSYTV